MTEAQQQYRHWLAQSQSQPSNAIAWFNLGWWSTKVGLFAASLKAYEQALAFGIESPEEAMANMASVYSERLGQTEPAMQWLDRALLENPHYYPAIFNRAHIAEQMGDRETACRYFKLATELAPDKAYPVARWIEANLTLPEASQAVQSLRQFAKAKDTDALMALARYEERAERYNAAWEALIAVNAVDQKAYPDWQALPVQSKLLSQLAEVKSQQPPPLDSHGTVAPSATVPTSPQQTPVFILGLFRTGSTLLEQILAAHSGFTPLGESEFWPRQIHALGGSMVSPGRLPNPQQCAQLREQWQAHLTERNVEPGLVATDKRPDNLFHMASIRAVLPEAKFLITERDWRDTLVSIFGTRLHPQHGYATSPEDIAKHISFCRKIADFWCENYPKSVYRVSYEALVTDPEKQLMPLFKWLGAPWHSDCLNFHELTNSVRTASVWQVREPLTTSRQGRWRNYDGPLRAIFGGALDSPEPPSSMPE